MPKGGPGDSNVPSTDVCGTKSAAYSGQWQYKDLISQKVWTASGPHSNLAVDTRSQSTQLLSSDGSKGASGYTRYFDSCTATPFLFNPSKKHYIGYDDATSASIKARWAIQQGLAGVCVPGISRIVELRVC